MGDLALVKILTIDGSLSMTGPYSEDSGLLMGEKSDDSNEYEIKIGIIHLSSYSFTTSDLIVH
eukprot:scaffold11791_cov297-Chaetoceros_neogracile.AAC.2